MPKREQLIATASLAKDPAESRIDIAWELTTYWLNALRLPVQPETPDFKKIIALMETARKPVTLVAVFDGQWLTLEARVDASRLGLLEFDASYQEDIGRWRASMVTLMQQTMLVKPEDLAAFDSGHPDPEVLQRLLAQIDAQDNEIARRTVERAKLLAELKALSARSVLPAGGSGMAGASPSPMESLRRA